MIRYDPGLTWGFCMKRLVFLALALLIVVLLILPAPKIANAQTPVVVAVLFYSPSCLHCHYVITEVWPQWNAEFGDQLEMLFIDVTVQGGELLFMNALEAYDVPSELAGSVPMLVINDTYLIGSADIPALAPDLIREGLAVGGYDLPPIPGLKDAYEAALAAQDAASEQEAGSGDAASGPGGTAAQAQQQKAPAASSELTSDVSEVAVETVGDRIARDPVGNTLAIGVLVGLLASFATVAVSTGRVLAGRLGPAWATGHIPRIAAVITGAASAGAAGTLVFGPAGSGIGRVLGVFVLALMLLVLLALLLQRDQQPGSWAVPLAAGAGLVAALYLAYVETTQSPAFCGAVGDCNTVQQSPYALLFGVLPVAVLGTLGYLAILAAWIVRETGSTRLKDTASLALLVFTVFGALFSIYLTFLEPFVIGATCAWCITSALVMLVLLWLASAQGLSALQRLINPDLH